MIKSIAIQSTAVCVLALAQLGLAADAPRAQPADQASAPTASQILERNAVARGGLTAWRAVQTLTFKGSMGAGATTYVTVTQGKMQTRERDEALLPFAMKLKRPAKQRLEIELKGERAVQVFDGTSGYKFRPFLGRKDWEAFSADELKRASDEPGIDGYLLDAATHGTRVELAGADALDGRPAYILRVTTKSGASRKVWVDKQTNLEVKIQGEPRKLNGKMYPVSVLLKDYRAEQGLLIPHTIETVVQGQKRSEKISIDTVAVNAKVEDSEFTRPK